MSMFVLFILLTVFAVPRGGDAADVHFAWNAPREGTPQGYIVERKTGLTGDYAEVGYPTGTTWTDSKIPATTPVPLCWQVRAFNELGKTHPSNELCLSLPELPEDFRMEIRGSAPSAAPLSIRTTIRKKR